MATLKVQLNRLRISPYKVRLVADAVRGKTVREAQRQLAVMEKRSAQPMEKLLKSGVANARHNYGFDADNLYIAELYVNEGMTLKRWMPRAHGRATKILKRTSHITMVLAEIEDGKNRVEPEQKTRTKENAGKVSDTKKQEDGSTAKSSTFQDTHVVSNKKADTAAAKKQRMFRRKSS